MRLMSMVSAVFGLAALLLASMSAGAELQEAKTAHFTGIVLAVDPSQDLLTVEQASEEAPEIDFIVLDSTEIMKDGKSMGLSAIEVGDPVSVEYEETTRGNEARSVEIITKPQT